MITVKVGGMRVVQHKTPNHERPAADIKDCTGLMVILENQLIFYNEIECFDISHHFSNNQTSTQKL